MFDLLHYDK